MGQTKVKRRYTNQKTDEYKLYNDTFDKCVLESNVLNRQPLSINTQFWDKNNLITEIALYAEEVIPAREAAVMEAHNAFASYQAGRKREGRTVDDVWPTHILSRRCKAEARLDVAKREKEFLEERLEKYYTKVEAELEEKGVLEFGPRGQGVLRNGVLATLDGQRVEPFKLDDGDEILVIASKTSPYYGMAVVDYRTHVIVPWVKARRMQMSNLEKQRQKELAETGFSKIIVRSTNRKVHPSSIPAWPEGVKNYFEVHSIVDEVVEAEDVEKLQ